MSRSERDGESPILASDLMNETQALAREFSTPTRRLIPSSDGTLIADFSPIDFKIRFPKLNELRFQHFFKKYFQKILESGLTVDEAIVSACADADLSEDWARKYLRSKRYKAWVEDRMAELDVAQGITPGYIAMKHKLNIDGEIKLESTQQTSLAELADRVWPKVQKVEHKVETADAFSMDELMQARRDVEVLEKQLAEKVNAKEPEVKA